MHSKKKNVVHVSGGIVMLDFRMEVKKTHLSYKISKNFKEPTSFHKFAVSFITEYSLYIKRR